MPDMVDKMTLLDKEAGELIDGLFENDGAAPPGDAIAPMLELEDPDRGLTEGDPGRGAVEVDLDLLGEQREEREARVVEQTVGRDGDGTALQTEAADLLAVDSLFTMDRETGDLDAFEQVFENYGRDF